jgi:hypothetical protein
MKQRKGKSEGAKGASESSQSADDETSREDNRGRGTDAMAVLGMLLAAIGDTMRGAIAIVRKTPEVIGSRRVKLSFVYRQQQYI